MILEEFIGKYQINLTKQQLEGVTSIEMPTLLLAVPGKWKNNCFSIQIGLYDILQKHNAGKNSHTYIYSGSYN